jgi:hypothetical protein
MGRYAPPARQYNWYLNVLLAFSFSLIVMSMGQGLGDWDQPPPTNPSFLPLFWIVLYSTPYAGALIYAIRTHTTRLRHWYTCLLIQLGLWGGMALDWYQKGELEFSSQIWPLAVLIFVIVPVLVMDFRYRRRFRTGRN